MRFSLPRYKASIAILTKGRNGGIKIVDSQQPDLAPATFSEVIPTIPRFLERIYLQRKNA
jgi:hypothetical protein